MVSGLFWSFGGLIFAGLLRISLYGVFRDLRFGGSAGLMAGKAKDHDGVKGPRHQDSLSLA